MATRTPPGTLENFFSKVEKTEDSWLWQGGRSRQGYGRYYEGKTPDGRAKVTTAHRWLYEQVVGPIPDGLVLDHLCRTRECVNLRHLEAVSLGENARRGFDARGHKRNPTKRHTLVVDDDFARWALKTSKHIETVEDCWNWLGGTDSDGYGRIGVPQPGGSYKTVRAHRWFYETFVGPIPDNHVLDHTCRNRMCVNPDHLIPLTHGEHISKNWQERRESRTHCKHGHDLSVSGTDKSGNCKQCNRDKVAKYRAEKSKDPAYRADRAQKAKEARALAKKKPDLSAS